MGVIRNFIEIIGIASENDLPDKSYGQLIKYSEADNIFVPEDKAGIKDIFQIAINIEVKSKRAINTSDCITVVVDGVKRLKILHSQDENSDKLVMLNLQLPYNTFFEVPLEIGEIENIKIHILDAYFEVQDRRRIYGHFIYLIDARYSLGGTEPKPNKNSIKVELLSAEQVNESNEPQIALSHEDFAIWDENYAGENLIPQENPNKYFKEDIYCLYL